MNLKNRIISSLFVFGVMALGVSQASQGKGTPSHGGCCATEEPGNCRGCCDKKWTTKKEGYQRCLANCKKGNCKK
jgi:hypothetical protein